MRYARTTGLSREKLTDSLRAQLTDSLTHADLDRHEKWYMALKALSHIKKAHIIKYQERRAELITQAAEATAKYRADRAEEAIREEQEKLAEEYRSQLRRRLYSLRSDRYESEKKMLAQIEEMRLAAQERARTETLQAERETQEKRRAVQEFLRAKQQQADEARLAQIARQAEISDAVRAEIENNRPFVLKRQEMRVEKEEVIIVLNQY